MGYTILAPSVPNRGVIAYDQRREGLVVRRILGSPPRVGIPLSGTPREGKARRGCGCRRTVLANEPTPEANRYGVGSASCLKLRQQVPDVRLDGFLREEETLADLAIDEAVRDELENLDLSSRRILADLPRRRRRERDHRAATSRATPRRGGLESPAVIAVPVQDLSALSSVHVSGIGAVAVPL